MSSRVVSGTILVVLLFFTIGESSFLDHLMGNVHSYKTVVSPHKAGKGIGNHRRGHVRVDFTCTAAGVFPDSSNCTNYFRCVSISGDLYSYHYTCPNGAYFDSTQTLCVPGTCSNPTTLAPTTSPPPTTTAPPPTCVNELPFANPADPTTHYQCFNVDGTLILVLIQCAPGGVFIPDPVFGGSCGLPPTTPTTVGPVSSTPTSASPSTDTSAPTSASPSTDTSTPTTEVPASTTAGPFKCTTEGVFADPVNCVRYYICRKISDVLYTVLGACPTGAFYNTTSQLCAVGTC